MKNEGDYRVNRTRYIPLKEADTNENSTILAKDASVIADNYKLLDVEQYRKLHGSSIYLATNKWIAYNMSRQMKHPIAVCSNNARSCYDMIVHLVAFLAFRRLSIPTAMIISMLHTIQQIEHIICTSFGNALSTGLMFKVI